TNAGYWAFATQSNWDNVPSNTLSATGTNNASYTAVISVPPFGSQTDPINWFTPVGAFANSPSSYGTYDQSGLVWQWTDTPFNGMRREQFGGSWASDSLAMSSSGYNYPPPSSIDLTIGFRVASVPEPSTINLLVATAAAWLYHIGGRRKALRR